MMRLHSRGLVCERCLRWRSRRESAWRASPLSTRFLHSMPVAANSIEGSPSRLILGRTALTLEMYGVTS